MENTNESICAIYLLHRVHLSIILFASWHLLSPAVCLSHAAWQSVPHSGHLYVIYCCHLAVNNAFYGVFNNISAMFIRGSS
jgi:hypothetical protein